MIVIFQFAILNTKKIDVTPTLKTTNNKIMSQSAKLYIIVCSAISYQNGGYTTEVHCANSEEGAKNNLYAYHDLWCGETMTEINPITEIAIPNILKPKKKLNIIKPITQKPYCNKCKFDGTFCDLYSKEFCIRTYTTNDVNFSIRKIHT